MSTRARIAWRRPLRHLLDALAVELARPGKPSAAVAELPNGAFVMLEVLPSGQRRVSIGRATRPVGSEALRRWGQELATFQAHLGLTRWTPVPATARVGIAVAYLEPAPPAPATGLDFLASAPR